VSQTTVARSGVSQGGRDGAAVVPKVKPRSYYGEPILAHPVWTPEIPVYFFVGGMAGASAPLALFASLTGNERLARSATATALAGVVISPALLIKDLGRPERFLHMLRVFKPSSPMSVGSWVLSAFGAAASGAAARELAGVLPRAGRGAQVASALLGPVLSTYTATLISNTSIPIWHEARHHLPFVFAAGSAATAGAAAVLLTPHESAEPARRVAIGAAAAEVAVVQVMERHLGPLGAPYHEGTPGRLARAAKAFTAGGAAALALGRGPVARRLGAGSVLVGGALERFAIFRAGFASADDPAYTSGPQRERLAHP
jgi:hypothetical protein